jgi:hypothetical protein
MNKYEKNEEPVSILVKWVSDLGKYLCVGFKSGFNIMSRLEGCKFEGKINIDLRKIKYPNNIFDNFVIFGQTEIVLIP